MVQFPWHCENNLSNEQKDGPEYIFRYIFNLNYLQENKTTTWNVTILKNSKIIFSNFNLSKNFKCVRDNMNAFPKYNWYRIIISNALNENLFSYSRRHQLFDINQNLFNDKRFVEFQQYLFNVFSVRDTACFGEEKSSMQTAFKDQLA